MNPNLDQRIPATLPDILRNRVAQELSLDGFTRAAVLLTVLQGEREDFVLFTQRTEKVEHHKGQISFPGGRLDDNESLLECALRETEEEVGIRRADIRVVGRLDDTWTPTGYVITPFIGLVSYPYDFTISPDEIDNLLIIPLRRVLCPDRFEENEISFLGRTAPVPFYYIDNVIVWGATARILRQFLETVFARENQPCDG